MMETPRSLAIVNYAVNGSGVGHVQRLCAINRWLRRYCAFCGVRSQHWFLTTSEADTWLFGEGFAAFKLPSKSIVEPAGIAKPEYLAMAKQWIWTALATLRPALLVVDTFPGGCFDELAPALELCTRKVLVLRPVRSEIGQHPAFLTLARCYDRVVVPEDQDAVAPPLAEPPSRVAPIMLDEPFERLPRAEARSRLGVDGERYCLLVSGGGGGDPGVPALLDAVAAALPQDDSVHVVFAAGPLCRLPPRRGPRCTWWTEPGLGQVLAGVDGAICAAGYNSAHELMHAGVPTAFVAQRKIADDQEARADALVRRGAALRLSSLDASDVALVLAELREPAKGASLSAAARRAVPRNGARDAAATLLELCLPRSLVRQARETLDDDLLAEARGLGAELGDLVDVALALLGARRVVDRASLELDGALTLARSAAAVGLPGPGLARLATAFARKICVPDSSPEHNGRALARLLSHPTASGQWLALGSLLAALPATREPDTGRATDALLALIDAGAGRGVTISRLTHAVVETQGEPEAAGSAWLARVQARLAGGA